MKKCGHCQQIKDEGEFYKNLSRKDGLSSQCKVCVNEYRKTNPDKIKAAHKKYKEANPDKGKAWRKTNPDKLKAQNRRHSERVKAKWLIWFKINFCPIPSPNFHYHHIDSKLKSFEIAKWFKFHSCNPENIELMKAEIDKCMVLDRALHSKYHSKRFRKCLEIYEKYSNRINKTI